MTMIPNSQQQYQLVRQAKGFGDRVLPFEAAEEAYAWMGTGGHFGKIVIRL
ncbi:MAG: hypothetical protein IT481_07635 [Gammaproteobacteria bacterium]|nr:hypothetical protein [Gammaproteobacteria bacterium]